MFTCILFKRKKGYTNSMVFMDTSNMGECTLHIANRKTQRTTVVIIKTAKTTTTNRMHVHVHVGVSFREYACVDMTLMGERG